MELGSVQADIDDTEPDGLVALSAGDYGPITINKPLTLTCSGACFWTDGTVPALRISAGSVCIQNATFRVSGGGTDDPPPVILEISDQSFPTFQSVKFQGTIQGLPGESEAWILPRILNLGEVRFEESYFSVQLAVSVNCRLISRVSGVDFDPHALVPGVNRVKMRVRDVHADSILIGDLELITSQLTRLIPLYGTISKTLGNRSNAVTDLYQLSAERERAFLAGRLVPAEMKAAPAAPPIEVTPSEQIALASPEVLQGFVEPPLLPILEPRLSTDMETVAPTIPWESASAQNADQPGSGEVLHAIPDASLGGPPVVTPAPPAPLQQAAPRPPVATAPAKLGTASPHRIIWITLLLSIVAAMTWLTIIALRQGGSGPLTNEQWSKLTAKVQGTLTDEPITFRQGQVQISEEDKGAIKESLAKLGVYGNRRFLVEAHVAPSDSSEADQKLSDDRALEVKQFLTVECGVQASRVLVKGFGSNQPPERSPSESDQEWNRLSRSVRILLLSE